MTFPSLQAGLTRVQLEQIKTYLTARGWKNEPSQGRLCFTKQPNDQDGIVSVFVPDDISHPKFRSLLQNMVFSLSVVEGREPMELVADIVQTVTAAKPAATTLPQTALTVAPQRSRITLRNTADEVTSIYLIDDRSEFELQPNEEAVLVVSTNPTSECVLEIRGKIAIRGIQSKVGDESAHQALYALPKTAPSVDQAWFKNWINLNLMSKSLVSDGQSLLSSSETQSDPPRELFAAVNRFLFAIQSDDTMAPVPALMRAMASLLCEFAQASIESDAMRVNLFQLARLLLAGERITFMLSSEHQNSLWSTAREDDTTQPIRVLRWLKDNSTRL